MSEDTQKQLSLEVEDLKARLREATVAAPLYEEHGQLTGKIFREGLSKEEQVRLDWVRSQLNALEVRRIESWQAVAARIDSAVELLENIPERASLESDHLHRALEVLYKTLREMGR